LTHTKWLENAYKLLENGGVMGLRSGRVGAAGRAALRPFLAVTSNCSATQVSIALTLSRSIARQPSPIVVSFTDAQCAIANPFPTKESRRETHDHPPESLMFPPKSTAPLSCIRVP